MKISFANGSWAAWLTRAVGALRNRNRIQVTHTALSMHDEPQITAAWDYRPRKATRRGTAFDCGGAGTAELANSSTSTPKENAVWFNFTKAEATAESAPTIAAMSTDVSEDSMYDQSPIDNGTSPRNDGHQTETFM